MKETPLPKRTLFILSTVILVEPLSMTILFPFVYFMVKEFGLTSDERQIGFYVGFIASSFSVAQFLTSIFWGWLSDKLGRRPVILLGLIGNTLSMLLFGMSHSFMFALCSRSLCGILNGNVAISKCMITEVTDKSNRAKGFSYFGLAFGLGLIIGPTIGGYLSHPVEKYPLVFGGFHLLKRNPYFLPCFVSACISLMGFIVGFIFLPETSRKHQSNEEEEPLLSESISNESMHDQRMSTQPLIVNQPTHTPVHTLITQSQTTLFNNRLIFGFIELEACLCIVSYALLAFFNIIFDETFALYMVTPIEQGGLGYASNDIGFCLSIMGICGIVTQVVVYPPLQRQINTVKLYQFSMLLYPLVFGMFPIITLLAKHQFNIWCWLILLMTCRTFCNVFAFTSIMMLINNSTANDNLGVVNGIAQTCSAFVRSFGPALGGIMWSFSLTNQLGFPFDYNFVFIVLSILSMLSWIQTLWIPRLIVEDEMMNYLE